MSTSSRNQRSDNLKSSVVSLNVGGTIFSAKLGTLIGNCSLLGEILGHLLRPTTSTVRVEFSSIRTRGYVATRPQFFPMGALALPDNFAEWELLKREIVLYKIPRLTNLICTLGDLVKFRLSGKVFRCPRKTLLRIPYFKRVLQGEATITVDDD